MKAETHQNFCFSTSWEKCFQIRFWTLLSAPTRKHALSLPCVFRLGHFPRSKIDSEIIFLIKYYIITILKKIGAFRPFFNKVKELISHCIFKSCAEGFKCFFFQLGSYLFLPNDLYLPTKQPWGPSKF